MGKLWQEMVELLGRRPVLALPVLIADLLGWGINLGRNGLIQLIVLHATAQQSALGGAVVHGPMSASTAQNASILALLLSWTTYFLRVLLYSTALFVTAALVNAFRERAQHPFSTMGSALTQQRGGIFELALRALAIDALAALLLSWLSPQLARHGHGAWLHNAWFTFVVTLVFLLVLSLALPPAALRLLAGHLPARDASRQGQQLAMLLALVASALAAFVNTNSRELRAAPLLARYPLELVGSLVVALPYVLLFTGLALLAHRRVADDAIEPA